MNTLTLNSSELTALHTETLTAMRNEKTLANITRRALTLFSDGYRRTLLLGTLAGGVFAVTAPEGHSYIVTAKSGVLTDSCDCPSFAKLATCKHLEAVQMLIDETAAVDALAAMHEAAEGQYGCDKYARF